MLYARTISKLARQLFSDVIGIGYVEGEIIDSRGVSDDSRGIVEPEVIQSETESLFDKILKEFPQSDRPHFVNFRQKIAKQLGQTPEYTDVIMFGDLEKTKTSFKIYMERMNEKVVHSIERVSDIDNSSVDT
jgi:iron uptake system EfeUOB component EfeO/EfeM